MKYIILLFFLGVVQSKLRFVFELFRHGARTPMNAEKDLFNLTWDGDAELTPLGVRQHFLIGHQLRTKYIIKEKFISAQYNPKQIAIFSTDTNRTIMSAHSQLVGLYPAFSGYNISLEQQKIAIPPINIDDLDTVLQDLGNYSLPFNMQVIPVHIFDSNKFFNLQDNCPKIGNIQKENRNKEIITNFLNDFNTNFGEKIINLFNKSEFNFQDFDSVARFTDNFVCAFFDQRELASLKKLVEIESLYNVSLNFQRLQHFEVGWGDEDSYSARIVISPVLKRLFKYFDNIISSDKGFLASLNDPKFVMYSAHDTNIAQMLVTLNKGLDIKFKEKNIPFASNIIIEFSQDDIDNNYIIEIFYNGEVIYKDSYNQFLSRMNSILVSDEEINTFCNLRKRSSIYIFYGITIICLASFSFILIIALIICFIKKRRLEYQHL
jgi:hypothetical protein